MRRVLVATLVLIPVMAHAQASTSTEPKATPASTTLLAKATVPPSPAGKAAPTPVAVVPKLALHETVKQHVQALYLDDANDSGSIGFTFQNGESTNTSPKLVHVVETAVPQDAVNVPVTVTVRMMVNNYGIPENITLQKSAGSLVDQQTIAAVKEFRFEPATVNHHPVPAEVTVDINLQKR